METSYYIGDFIYNKWKNNFYEIISLEYKSSSRYATLKNLKNNRILTNIWLYSQRVNFNNGNFAGYEDEYIKSSKNEALSFIRKSKISKLFDTDETI